MQLKYKFLPLDTAVRVLESKRIKVSLLAELNDVFDCSPIIAPPPDEPGYTDQQWTEHVVGQNNRNTGLVCLSKTFRSPLLWGHYAGSATGLALGFDADLFPWGQHPMDVRYDHSRPHFAWAADDAIDAAFVDHMLRCSFGVKATEWSYEEEVRYLLALDTCTTAVGMYFAPFPPNSLKQIIVGFRSSLDRLYLTRFLQQQYPGQVIEVRHSRPHPTQYEIELLDLPIA